MRSFYKGSLTLVVAAVTFNRPTLAPSAHADAPPAAFMSQSAAKFASGPGTFALVAGSVALPLLEDGHQGSRHSLRTADSLITSTLITEGLKHIVGEKRPDSNARNSFPSGHATAVFAAASMASHWHPGQAPLWYLGATAIAVSRVRLHRHFWHDVIAGAVIGYGTTRLELSRRHGLLLAPFIRADDSRDKPQDNAMFPIVGRMF